MYREAFDEVAQLRHEIFRCARVRRLLCATQAELHAAGRALALLQVGLDKEEHDVAKLEGRSLTRLLLAAMGKVERRLDKERREALQARLLVEAKATEVELLQREVARLKQELAGLDGIEAKYECAMAEKTHRLIQTGGEAGRRVEHLLGEVTKLSRHRREIEEALEAGTSAENHLCDAMEAVRVLDHELGMQTSVSAMVLGGPFLGATPSLPLARRLEASLQHAHHAVHRYARELADIPGWSRFAEDVVRYGDLLQSFVHIVGGATAAAIRSKHALRHTHREVCNCQGALALQRNDVGGRYEDALRRYRDAVELS